MEENLKEVPVTIETAHQFFNKRQMRFIVKMFKENYRQGFLNGMKMKVITALLLLLFTSVCFGQLSIVSAGNQTETIGEVFPIMQTVIKKKEEVSLGTPKFEIPTEEPKKVIKEKPKTFLEKLILIFKKLFK